MKELGPIKHYATIHIVHIKHGGNLFSFNNFQQYMHCTRTCLLLSVLILSIVVYVCNYAYKYA
jgi:hypothetical protein